MARTGSLLTSLGCRACCTEVASNHAIGVCPTCGHALLATYDLDRLDRGAWRAALKDREATLWRYLELLPVQDTAAIATLGEGFSPIVRLRESPDAPGVRLVLKDDGQLPTGSFKARGMAVAVSRARELGLRDLFVPSAGNAGVALAAYAARAGLSCRVYLPERTAPGIQEACRRYGAEVRPVPGTIREAGAAARAAEKAAGSFEMSTLREPYRVEGKKTMGLEIWEQLPGDEMPDTIVYPTGGGTGLVGMHKAFTELRSLGLLERPPRLIAVQPAGCAPVVRALSDGSPNVSPWTDPMTIAPGLLVPAPFSSERILEAVRDTGGRGVAVSDAELVDSMARLAARDGVSASPEAAAPYAALASLFREGAIRAGEKLLLYCTGTGLPFSVDTLREALTSARPPP